MNRDKYLLYAISIVAAMVIFEFAVVILQSVSKHIKSRPKITGACRVFLCIARIIYLIFTVIISEYLYVNRSAGVGSIALGCAAFFAIREVFKSKAVITAINRLTRPIICLITFAKKIFTVKKKKIAKN